MPAVFRIGRRPCSDQLFDMRFSSHHVAGYYADHPQVVKTLGSAALAIALAGVANRVRR